MTCDQTNAISSRSKLVRVGSKSLHLTDVSVQETSCMRKIVTILDSFQKLKKKMKHTFGLLLISNCEPIANVIRLALISYGQLLRWQYSNECSLHTQCTKNGKITYKFSFSHLFILHTSNPLYYTFMS